MAEANRRKPVPAGREAERAEAASAGQVVQTLVKADRGFAIYLPNNPLHQKFFEDLRLRLDQHLESFGILHLDLTHDSLACRGETIYANPELRENLAFRMYADGLRALRIEAGIESSELRTLVEILGRPAAETDEDDIVTRLWSSDLPHVGYVIAELPTESGAGALAPGGVRISQDGALRRYASELAAAPPAAAPPPLPQPAQQIFNLSEEELATLQELVAREEQRSPLEDMICILEAIVSSRIETAVLEEFLEILARLCGDFLLAGRVDQAIGLLSMLSRTAVRPGLPPGHGALIGGTRERVLTADVLAGLSRLLAGEGLDRGGLRALVVVLGHSAIEPFCRILGDVPDKETRKVLIDALAETGRASPATFLPFLLDARWYLVRNTICILRRIAGPEVAPAVYRCAGHQDPRVRKEVLLYCEETGDPAGESVLLALLGDETPSLRLAAARGLMRRGSRAAADRLLALTASPGFAGRERLEREAVWEALGALAPARVLPTFREMLLKRRWFGQAKDLDDTACACAGLRRIGTPEAIEILRQGAAGKRGEARELVERALRALARSRGPDGRTGERDGGEADRG
jgi:hypothetical protein